MDCFFVCIHFPESSLNFVNLSSSFSNCSTVISALAAAFTTDNVPSFTNSLSIWIFPSAFPSILPSSRFNFMSPISRTQKKLLCKNAPLSLHSKSFMWFHSLNEQKIKKEQMADVMSEWGENANEHSPHSDYLYICHLLFFYFRLPSPN